MILGIL